MAHSEGVQVDASPRLFFTAPWDPIVVRRGDALGLRGLADQFADAVAPDLSNRVRDGRWVTILAWCLVRSQEAFHASGGRSVATRAQQRERYSWLRPVELLYAARTIALADDWRDRTLAGQRRLRSWYEDQGQAPNRFGMSVDQFRSYRQTGMYGGYRLAFRTWPGMTVLGDGWTPSTATHALARWLEAKLGAARPDWPLHATEDHVNALSTRSAKLMRDDPYRWWLKHWPAFDENGRQAEKYTLPRRRTDFDELPEAELLTPLVFGSDPHGRRRRDIATEIAKASANDHLAVCEHLSKVFAEHSTIARLPLFSRLADAGMALMDVVADALGSKPSIALEAAARHAAAKHCCRELLAASQAWKLAPIHQPRHVETANRFAGPFANADPADCIRQLLQHHEIHGGGLRWFVLRNGRIEPRTPPRGLSSRYRFRLWSLCRLATQCGVLRTMPAALRRENELEGDEAPNGDSNE